MVAEKTAVSVLQEMLMKFDMIPEYECIAQNGPKHQSTFEYCCKTAYGQVTAIARSKKEAKQEVARRMLNQLSVQGMPVPPPYNRPPSPGSLFPDLPSTDKALPSAGTVATDVRSYVALLKELCEEYGMGSVEYELVGDSGPAHSRLFTVLARLARTERQATATTKKAARQRAAELLYRYLRENLERLTPDFVEEEALERAHERAMERYMETRGVWRAPLGQRLADYHLGLLNYIDNDKIELGRQALDSMKLNDDPISALERAASALGVSVSAGELAGGVSTVALAPTAPPLVRVVFAGRSSREAAASALRYLLRALARTATRAASRTPDDDGPEH